MIPLLTSSACSFIEGRFTSMTRGSFPIIRGSNVLVCDREETRRLEWFVSRSPWIVWFVVVFG